MADDNVPTNPSTPPPSTSYHEVADLFEGKLNIDYLKDADSAGDYTKSCTLFLTEGVSAQNFADGGIQFLGHELYGSYPLNGKPVNVNGKAIEELDNVEFLNVKKIIGLEYHANYDDETVKKLRYRHIVLMCDQDYDGSHIKGLVINWFLNLWPSLLKVKNFLRMFITPLVKASCKNETRLFYSLSKFDEWRLEIGMQATKKYKFNYNKGLASIHVKEAPQYFREYEEYVKDFIWVDELDDNAIKRSFYVDLHNRTLKKDCLLRALKQEQPDTCTSGSYLHSKKIRYLDFCNNELIESFVYNIRRSIPSMVDGLKVSQRKVLFYLFGQGTNDIVKVPSLSSGVVEHTSYHHGDQNLDGVIVRMARDYIGSNNVNLLQPIGIFESRAQSRKRKNNPAVAPRYLETQLSSIARFIFHIDDEHLLEYLWGFRRYIEPRWFIPVIPMILVNGCRAIAPGYNSDIPNYDPLDIIANLIRLMKGQPLVPMLPWYKDNTGTIEVGSTPGTYTTKGVIKEENNILRITELPIGTRTEDYITDVLDNLKRGVDYMSYTPRNVGDNVNFEITMNPDQMEMARNDNFKKFKLTSSTLKTTNMNLFDDKGRFKTYETPEEILQDFFRIRLEFYVLRRKSLIRELIKASLVLNLQVKYFKRVLDGDIKLVLAKGAKLVELGFPSYETIVSMADLESKDYNDVEDLKVGEENPQASSSSETVRDYLSKAFGEVTEDLKKRLKRAKRRTTLPSIDLKPDKKVEDESDDDEDKKDMAEGNVNQIGKDEEKKEVAMDHHYVSAILKETDLETLEKEKEEKDKELNELIKSSSKSLWLRDLHALYLQLLENRGL